MAGLSAGAEEHSKHREISRFPGSRRCAARTEAEFNGGMSMYAVIRAGGKQYRVAPGDVVRVESLAGSDGKVSFGDVLAVSGSEGQIVKPGADVHVTGEIVEQGRAAKVLVFHYKRKKQYKKLAGHRQPFTAVRITEIAFDGQTFTAPELPKKEAKVTAAPVEVEAEPAAKAAKAPAKKKAAAKKPAAKKAAPKKKK
jgi:large subunit ribosomal protein L21